MPERIPPPRGLKGACPICGRQFDKDEGNCNECPWVLWQRLNVVYQAEKVVQEEMRADIKALMEAVDFYANPETYFAIAFISDPPCGAFVEDFSETALGMKPGKKARQAMGDEP